MKNILTYERYGKQNLIKRVFFDVKNRFSINKFAEENLRRSGIAVYIPKVNKFRFTTAIILASICIVLPVITILSVPIMMWGIK